MSELFNTTLVSEPEIQERVSTRALEVCPQCGAMGFIERFANGRFMASHENRNRHFKGLATGANLSIIAAQICHGFQK